MRGEDTPVRSHKDLRVWQRAMGLVHAVYQVTEEFPKKEEYRLTSQMIRAAISIPANIAEGNARSARKDYARFVSIARGSAAELETLLLLTKGLNYVSKETLLPIIRETEELSYMLNGLREKPSGPSSH